MSRVKNKDTGLERIIRSTLHKRGLRFNKPVRKLPGTPDIVFPRHQIAVFIDGDFWHGYRFSTWESKLSDFWKVKIKTNIKRDRKNFRKLRKMGWRVVRIWQHQMKRDLEACITRVIREVEQSRGNMNS